MKILVSLSAAVSMPAFKNAVKALWPDAHKFSHVGGTGYFAEIHGSKGKACKNLESKGYKEKSSGGVNEFTYVKDGVTLKVSEDDGKTVVYMPDN